MRGGHQVETGRTGIALQRHEAGQRIVLLLATGAQDTRQSLLRAGAGGGAVATPRFAGAHRGAKRPFGDVVGRVEPRAVEETEERRALMIEVVRQAPVGGRAHRARYQAIHRGFEAPGRDGEAVRRHGARLKAIAQRETLFQERGDGLQEPGGPGRGDRDQVLAAAEQVCGMPMSAYRAVCQLPEYAAPASSRASAGGPRDDHVGIFTAPQGTRGARRAAGSGRD